QARLAEAEIVLDRGQGDVDDRAVEDDHQHRRAEDVEGDPAAALGAGQVFGWGLGGGFGRGHVCGTTAAAGTNRSSPRRSGLSRVGGPRRTKVEWTNSGDA